jgi:hypothetical protein
VGVGFDYTRYGMLPCTATMEFFNSVASDI